MRKYSIIVTWVLVLLMLVGGTVYADSVIPIPMNTDEHVCGMYYNEEGVAVWPEECYGLHSNYELQKGDKIAYTNGGFGTIVGLGAEIDIPDWAIEKGIFNEDGSRGPNYEEYKDELTKIPFSTAYVTVQADTYRED